MTDKPDACPVTRQLMYHFPRTGDCTRRRATLDFAIPPHIFNCSYATPEDFEATFYVQLEVDLAFDTCLPPDGKYYAGSRRKAISPGCSYITVTAQCTPSTCDRPTLSAEELAAQNGSSSSSNSLLPVIIGVSVGTGVLVLAILGGVLYARKRQRDEAIRRKLQHKYSGGMEGGEDELVTSDEEDYDPEDDYELDFSGKSNATAAFGGLGRNSIFTGRSALFSRSHRSTVGGRSLTALGGGGGGGYYPGGGMGGSMIVPPGGGYVGGGFGTGTYASATGAAMMGMGGAYRGGIQSEIQPSFMVGSGGSMVGVDRPTGARRFVEKYERRDTGGHGHGTPLSPGGAAYGNAAYGMTSATASYSLAFTGRDSAAISHLHPQPEIELHEDNYQLARMSAKMTSGGGAGGSGSAAASPAGVAGRKSPSLPRPAAAVTGRSAAQVAAELGLESPAGAAAAGHSVTRGAGAAGAPPPAPLLAGAAAAAAAAHGAGADVYGAYENPELVPDNASAFINPLAMMAGESSSSDDDAAVAPSVAAARRAAAAAAPPPRAAPRAATGYKSWTQEARMASKQELSPSSTAGGSGSGGGAAAGGGTPSTVGAAHASSSYSHSQVWGSTGPSAAAQAAIPAAMMRRQQAQQAAAAPQQSSYQAYGAGTTDDETEDGEDLMPSERRRRGGGGSATSTSHVAHVEGDAGGSGSGGVGTLVIPVASQHAEGDDE
ncbi:hypothetical protein HXX76_008959 [Chlamydomonas incerta]|uniref:Uncharacterized protein n=1 Tax=Chlamydomonas incerta TaxID=51695 RepID=A0A835T2H0_CHLIN|nr:hypothetical protein HXX76_008959 [Chlamydomonas incerta]|eukprot:KAG2432619.1 hypothetical protein HXX76_008959 [Chlamydomonas incerta]